MQVEIVAILLALFARLAEPVPVERGDLIGEDRTTSVDELAELNNIVNNVGKPRAIVKKQSTEDYKATEEKSAKTTVLKNVETSKPSVKPTKFLKPYQTEIKATPSAEKTESSVALKNIKPSPSFVEVEKIVSPAKLKVDHESKKKSEASGESITVVVSVNKISPSKEGGNEQGSEGTRKEGNSASTLVGRTKNYNKENAKKTVPSDTLARRTVNNQVNNDEELDLAAEGTDNQDLGVISSKKVSQTIGNGDQETTQENLKKMPKVTVEKVTDKVEDKDKDKEGVQITVEKIKENEGDDGTEEEDLESDEKKKENQERTKINQREIIVKESKAIPEQEVTKVVANDESQEEDEEKDLGIVGITADENARNTKDDESQTKVINLNTTGKRPQTEIPKVTVIKVETKEKEIESEENKLTKTAPLKVIEATKVKGEKLTTVDKEKGGANETAESIKEPQQKVTVIVEILPQEDITESKRDQKQEEALEEEQLEEEELKKTSRERSNAVAGNQPSVLSDEAKDAGMSNGETIDKAQGNEDLVGSKKTGESMTSEEEDLMHNYEENTEEQKLAHRRSEVILKDMMPKYKEDESELELENEKEQEMQALKESPDIKKIAQEFDKALKKERTKSQATTKAPKLTVSIQLNETVDAHQSSEKVLTKTQSPKEPNTQVIQQENDSKEKLSVEELELAQLAESAMSDDKEAIATHKKQEKPGHTSTITENQTTAPTEPTKATENIVFKVEKLSKEEVSVPKHESGGLSNKKEPPQKENKPKFTNFTPAPNIKPDDRKLQKNPVVENDDKETDLNSKKEDEDELEAEAK